MAGKRKAPSLVEGLFEDAPPVLPKRHKYGAVQLDEHGLTKAECENLGIPWKKCFDSKREYRRFMVLDMLQRGGAISDLKRQVRIQLHAYGPDGEPRAVCVYVADFTYVQDGKLTVEDAKGHRTEGYVIKRKFVEAEYGIKILET